MTSIFPVNYSEFQVKETTAPAIETAKQKTNEAIEAARKKMGK